MGISVVLYKSRIILTCYFFFFFFLLRVVSHSLRVVLNFKFFFIFCSALYWLFVSPLDFVSSCFICCQTLDQFRDYPKSSKIVSHYQKKKFASKRERQENQCASPKNRDLFGGYSSTSFSDVSWSININSRGSILLSDVNNVWEQTSYSCR